MEVAVPTQVVDLSGVLAEKAMKVDVGDAVLYEALADAIYTRARWILEYAQNARDVDPNWTLELPTIFDPWCKFIDNGPSMSRDFMLSEGEYEESGFCTIFASTKRTTNEQSGGFGIGRLSGPQGTIFQCRNEDAIRTYALIKNGKSIPTVALLSEEPRPDDVPVGTTVSVPIDPKRVTDVTRDAERYLRFFGLPNFRELTWLVRSDTVGVLENETSDYITLVVGGYPFDIRSADLPSDFPHQLKQFVFKRKKVPVITVPIGVLDVALNRESIKFTERTKAALIPILEGAQNEIGRLFSIQLASVRTYWEACLATKQFTSSGYDTQTVNMSFCGRKLTTHFTVQPGASDFRVIDCTSWRYRSHGLPENLKVAETRSIGVDVKTQFVWVHDTHDYVKRTRQIAEVDHLYVVINDLAELDAFGNPPYIDLAQVSVVKGAARKSAASRIMYAHHVPRPNQSWGGYTQQFDATELVTTGKTSDYRFRDKKEIVWVPSKNSQQEAEFDNLVNLPVLPEYIVFVPKSARDAVPPTWVHIADYLKAKVPTRERTIDLIVREELTKRTLTRFGWNKPNTAQDKDALPWAIDVAHDVPVTDDPALQLILHAKDTVLSIDEQAELAIGRKTYPELTTEHADVLGHLVSQRMHGLFTKIPVDDPVVRFMEKSKHYTKPSAAIILAALTKGAAKGDDAHE